MTDTIRIEVQAETSQFKQGMADARKELGKTADAAETTKSGLSSIGDGLGEISPRMKTVTTQVSKLGEQFKKLGADFSSNGTMGKVSTTLSKIGNSSLFKKGLGLAGIAAVGSSLLSSLFGTGNSTNLQSFDKLNILSEDSGLLTDIRNILEEICSGTKRLVRAAEGVPETETTTDYTEQLNKANDSLKDIIGQLKAVGLDDTAMGKLIQEIGDLFGVTKEITDPTPEPTAEEESSGDWLSGIVSFFEGVYDGATNIVTGDWEKFAKGWNEFEVSLMGGDEALTRHAMGLDDASSELDNFTQRAESAALALSLLAAVPSGGTSVAATAAASASVAEKVSSAAGRVWDWVKGLDIWPFATGGVFEANSPQLAILGDNKTEPEVAAPYSMIVKAVQEAIGDTSAQQSRTINVSLQMDGRTLARASYDYIEAERVRRCGA